MKYLFLLLLATTSLAADLRVAVLDSGLDLNDQRFTPYLCKDGHQDFTGEGIRDYLGHGTHVTGTIIKHAGEKGYCLVILKFYALNGKYSMYRAALRIIEMQKPNFVNISGGGPKGDIVEYKIIKKLKKTTFVVAAGNNNKDLTEKPYYPACYSLKNIIPVGNIDHGGEKASSSNYGHQIKAWEVGENVESTCINNTICKMSGTSMSAATHTGKLIKKYVETH